MKFIAFLFFLSFFCSKLNANFQTKYFLPEKLEVSLTLLKDENPRIPTIRATPEEKTIKKCSHLEDTYCFATYGCDKDGFPRRVFFFEVETKKKVIKLIEKAQGKPYMIELSYVNNNYRLRLVKNKRIFNIWRKFIKKLKKEVLRKRQEDRRLARSVLTGRNP